MTLSRAACTSASAGMGLQPQPVQVKANDGQGELAAADQDVTLDQHQGQLRAGGEGRAVGIEQIVVADANGRTVPRLQSTGQPPGHVTPRFLDALRAGYRGADDLNGCWLAHYQSQPPGPQPQAGPLMGKGCERPLPADA